MTPTRDTTTLESLGQITTTEGARVALQAHGLSALALLRRHANLKRVINILGIAKTLKAVSSMGG